MKPGILVTRALFPEVIDRLAAHFEVDYHPEDRALPPDQLAARLAGKDGAITLLSDRIDAAALAGAPGLRALCNVAVGYNNYDLAAITAAILLHTGHLYDSRESVSRVSMSVVPMGWDVLLQPYRVYAL